MVCRVALALALAGLLVAVCAAVHGAGTMEVVSHVAYPMNDEEATTCDYQSQACAPLSDVWGYSHGNTKLALVGVINGISVVDTTNPNTPTPVAHFPGCLTEWRDLKTFQGMAYVVNDQTALCSCVEQPCQDSIAVGEGENRVFIAAHEGMFSTPLAEVGDVTARLVVSDPRDACSHVTTDFTASIALIQRGECTFSEKVLAAQLNGAVGVVIYNDRQDIVPPSMSGNDEGVTIPSVMITKADGEQLAARVLQGEEVVVSLLNASRTDNPLFTPPDGLVMLDLSNPLEPVWLNATRHWFTFAHNIYIEETRPYLYACGVSCLETDTECVEGLDNGGIMAFDISTPGQPELVAWWDDVYIHDIVVVEDNGRFVMYGAAIDDARVYRFDVTDCETFADVVFYWTTPLMAHNTWPTANHGVIYVTHEDFSMPITVYDISHPLQVQYLGNISVNIENNTIPHNVFIRGELMWASYYSEGVVVWDVSDPEAPKQVAHLDTSQGFYSGFHGVWGIFPLPGNSLAYASDIEGGLFLLSLDYTPSEDDEPKGGRSYVLQTTTIVVVMGMLLAVAGFFVHRIHARNRQGGGRHKVRLPRDVELQ